MNSFENPYANKSFESDVQLVHTLALIRSEKIGPVSFFDLIAKHGSPIEAHKVLIEKYKNSDRKICGIDEAEKELAQTKKFGGVIISIFSEAYPRILANIADAPPVITCRGKWQNLNEINSVAVVGARNASALARKFADRLGTDLAKNNITVTSGLARGIDFSAHSGALLNTGSILPTIGVIAGGIDNVYPKENAKLYDEMAEKGFIISENAFGSSPKADSFPRRNRIISGLSLITVLVEAAVKSGSLITARFAAEQGREVACVPGFPLDPRSGGTNMLIKNGAALIENSADVLNLLKDISLVAIPQKSNLRVVPEVMQEEIFVEQKPSKVANDVLLSNLSTTPITVDELVKILGTNIADLNSILIEYEMEGKVQRHAGGKVSKLI